MDQRQLQILIKLKDEVSKELAKVSDQLSRADGETSKWSRSLSLVKTAGLAAATAISGALIGMVGYGVKIASELETAEVGLTTLLGSSEEARKTVARLKIEAARTPFELPGLTQATQLLTSVTKSGDKSIDILLNVGEALAAMGKGQPELDRIIINLQQIASVGKASMLDIKQFAFAGIPIFEMLATKFDDVGSAIENGEVTFQILTELFDKANDAGGKFFNAYKNQAGTFTQVTSNLKDSFGIFAAEFVKQTGIFDGLKVVMMEITNIFNSFDFAKIKQSFDEFLASIDEKTGLITLLADAWNMLVGVFVTSLLPSLQLLWVQLQPFMPVLKELAGWLGTSLVLAIGILIVTLAAFVAGLAKVASWLTVGISAAVKGFREYMNWLSDALVPVIKYVDALISGLERVIELAGRVTKSVGSKISSAIGSVTSAIGFRASGGPVSAGSPYIVGERGPEMFVPNSSGTIIPNGAGGVVVNVYGDISGQDLIDKVSNALASRIKYQAKLS